MNKKFDHSKPIALGADHAGYEYKEAIKSHLEKKDMQVKDFGTHSPGSVDYPDFAHPTASSVENNETSFGILVCGSANGVAITANKHAAIRAAICWKPELATLSRLHNNANIICIPSRFVSLSETLEMIDLFIATEFEGGRHEERVNKISC